MAVPLCRYDPCRWRIGRVSLELQSVYEPLHLSFINLHPYRSRIAPRDFAAAWRMARSSSGN
jgi:hypothetical protein